MSLDRIRRLQEIAARSIEGAGVAGDVFTVSVTAYPFEGGGAGVQVWCWSQASADVLADHLALPAEETNPRGVYTRGREYTGEDAAGEDVLRVQALAQLRTGER